MIDLPTGVDTWQHRLCFQLLITLLNLAPEITA